MPNGKNPLMLMMALTMPGATNALGLGDIHIDSALNERLAAEIDIVGATAAELSDLRAAVANRETFLRYGADRPGFLASATFKVTQDSQGRPVLAVRSTEAFTDPMINFLVDLRWRKGELVRQYTLLLDPAGFAGTNRPAEANGVAAPDMPAAPSVATPIVETKTQTIARRIDSPSDLSTPTGAERSARKTTEVKVGAKATLRGIAWRVGERSESDLRRMMLAIFRANPSAFSGNINRLHLGAVLSIPSYAEVQAISQAEATREIHTQMAAWLPSFRAVQASAVPAAVAVGVAAAPLGNAPTAVPGEDTAAPKTAETTALDSRVQSLEHELEEMKGLLASQHDQLVGLERQEALAEKELPAVNQQAPQEQPSAEAQPSTEAQPVAATQAPAASQPGHKTFVPILGGTGLLASALAALYLRLRRRSPKVDDDRAEAIAETIETPADSTPEKTLDGTLETAAKAKVAEREHVREHLQRRATPLSGADTQETTAAGYNEETHPLLPAMAPAMMPRRVNNAAATITVNDPGETTVNLRAETVKMRADSAHIEVTRVDATRLDYNLVDLDMTAQHVHMPSVLNEQVVAKERRTNLADVLKMAIEREPDRHDLRMKLLELYYSAAATNRQAFLEVVQKLARDRDYMQADQWDKIAFMGRQIASENPLFAEEETAADDDLADCA